MVRETVRKIFLKELHVYTLRKAKALLSQSRVQHPLVPVEFLD